MSAVDCLLKACLLTGSLLIAQSAAFAAEYYVSLSGKDSNPGSIDAPFRTVVKGIGALAAAGDILNLRHGVYLETVDVANKHGAAGNPIVIRSYPGEHAYIDGGLSLFRRNNNADWEPAVLHDPAAHPHEYVSTTVLTQARVNRGAFLDRNPYTRLITYSNINDLRAANQTFENIIDPSDPRPGPAAYEKCNSADQDEACTQYAGDDARYKPTGYRRPWVYMGPGIWFNDATGRVHIRLSHTSNNINGLADYGGEIDPRQVPLALSPKDMTTLVVRGSSHLRIENLSVRHGGEYTVLLNGNEAVTFDHVRIFSGSYGLRGNSHRTTLRHCEIDGGMPTWYFRSDRKAEYYFLNSGTIVLNNLGKQTVQALLLGNPNDEDTEVASCEFRSGHDLYLVGTRFRFHHNWIHNLNDEGLVLDSGDNPDARVFQNVITKTLSPISFAGTRLGGPRYIYRNLVDVRAPTAGYRPRFPGDTDVWRYGNTFKSNDVDGLFDIFQNTFLVYAQGGQASYLHYRNLQGSSLRRSFNNVFVAVNPNSDADRAIAFLPSPCFPGPTDGNVYFRMGTATRDLLRYLNYACSGANEKAGSFANLDELYASDLFQQSKSRYAPGYEAQSIEANPRFKRIGADGVFRGTDDLRLGEGSPAIGGGVPLPPDLNVLDPLGSDSGAPDIGAYPFGSAPLEVGVDGRRSFPQDAGAQ
jgi:hypothetical protein